MSQEVCVCVYPADGVSVIPGVQTSMVPTFAHRNDSFDLPPPHGLFVLRRHQQPQL